MKMRKTCMVCGLGHGAVYEWQQTLVSTVKIEHD